MFKHVRGSSQSDHNRPASCPPNKSWVILGSRLPKELLSLKRELPTKTSSSIKIKDRDVHLTSMLFSQGQMSPLNIRWSLLVLD